MKIYCWIVVHKVVTLINKRDGVTARFEVQFGMIVDSLSVSTDLEELLVCSQITVAEV